MRIVILDDNQNLGELCKELVEQWGHEAIVFQDIIKSFNYFARNEMDLVLVDYQLMNDDFNGLDVIRYVKARRDVPCVLMTGSISQERKDALEPIADLVIDKIFLARDLEAILDGLQKIDQRNSKKEKEREES